MLVVKKKIILGRGILCKSSSMSPKEGCSQLVNRDETPFVCLSLSLTQKLLTVHLQAIGILRLTFSLSKIILMIGCTESMLLMGLN